MKDYREIVRNIIIEYSTVQEDYKYFTVPVRLDEDDIEALEKLLKENEELKDYKEQSLEIDNKEAMDALHMLLHCALKDTEYETQKGQFDIVISYINKLEQDNSNHQAAALKNDDYYKEVCNKNKKLEEQVEYLRRSCERKEEMLIEAQQECIECEKLCNKNKELEEENKELQKSVEQIYDDYQDVGRLMFEYGEKLEQSIPKSLIKEIIGTPYPEVAIQKILELLGEEK